MLIIDVPDLNGFKEYLRNDLAFFWTESKTAFILIKPLKEIAIRLIVIKTTPKEAEDYKMKHLWKHTAKYCSNFVIDGQDMVKIRFSKRKRRK